ncbi:MAG: hypothetical protein KDB71_04025 [Mycobacterium sp.]|nr:hypothetical protein [Mycobacterium sp.]
MIFNDRVNVTLKEKRFIGGTASTVVVFDGPVPGIVTFLDSDSEANRASARLQIFLSPFAFVLPPMPAKELLVLSWKQFTHLTVDGIVEPHYINSRLHHYKILAKAV